MTLDRRAFLMTLPAMAASRAFAQAPPAFKVNGLSQIALTVSDVRRSLEFYQGLFGMPIQARQGSTVLLRVGEGPRFGGRARAHAGRGLLRDQALFHSRPHVPDRGLARAARRSRVRAVVRAGKFRYGFAREQRCCNATSRAAMANEVRVSLM